MSMLSRLAVALLSAPRWLAATAILFAAVPFAAASDGGSASDNRLSPAGESPPGLAAIHMSVEPPADVSAFDVNRLQQQCMQQLPGWVAQLEDKASHHGDYEAVVHVVSVEPVVELLEPGGTAESLVQQGLRTVKHGLHFWEHPSLAAPNPLFMGAPTAVLPDLELGSYPEDPRVLIEVFRRKGVRILGRIEILFENHEPHPFDLKFEQMPTASFHRTAQWGHTKRDSSVTRVVRSAIQWSVAKAPPNPILIGVTPALEVLRVQLSPYTDRQKRRLFEEHGERFGRRDTQRLDRPLWGLDMAENAVVVAVGRMWVGALAREHGRELSPAELQAVADLDTPGVAELLRAYPPTREGAAALIGAYTEDPMAMVAKLGAAIERR